MPGTLLNITWWLISATGICSFIVLFFFFLQRETEAYQLQIGPRFKQRWSSWIPTLLSASVYCPVQGHVHDCAGPRAVAKIASGVRVREHVSSREHTRQSVACCGHRQGGFISGTRIGVAWESGSVSEWGSMNLTFKEKKYSDSQEGMRWHGGLAPQCWQRLGAGRQASGSHVTVVIVAWPLS